MTSLGQWLERLYNVDSPGFESQVEKKICLYQI